MVDRFLAQLAGWLIVHLARKAIRKNDKHEFEHLAYAIKLGSTARCSDGDCTLRLYNLPPYPNLYAKW